MQEKKNFWEICGFVDPILERPLIHSVRDSYFNPTHVIWCFLCLFSCHVIGDVFLISFQQKEEEIIL